MDLDGDGIISMYEMEFFYEEQVEKMEMLGIETLPFQDCLCQVQHAAAAFTLVYLSIYIRLSICLSDRSIHPLIRPSIR